MHIRRDDHGIVVSEGIKHEHYSELCHPDTAFYPTASEKGSEKVFLSIIVCGAVSSDLSGIFFLRIQHLSNEAL
jgi:hypothetical protein